MIIATTQTGHRLPAHVTPDGVTRFLATLPNKGSFKAGLFAASNPIIPRSDWKPFSRQRKDVPILNQGQVGSCNAHGFTSAVMRSRSQMGQTFDLLSASFLYAQINGGSDSGSSPDDAAAAISTIGICLDSEVPEGFYTARQISQSAYQTAKRFLTDAQAIYQIGSWDELVSAVILGFKVAMTVYVDGDWNNLDKDGAPPFYRGQGNHVVCDDDTLVQLSNGDIALQDRNSWDTTWGNDGRFTYTEAAVDNQPGFVAYAIKYAAEDPQDSAIVPPAS